MTVKRVIGHTLRKAGGTALLAILLLFASAPEASARNPLSSYLSRLLDESRAEIAIGQLLADGFIAEVAHSADPMAASAAVILPAAADDEFIRRIVADFSSKCPRPTLPYSVTIIDSSVPADIPFPGGPIVITTALWRQAAGPAEKEFLIAHNLMHVALRQPMIALKHEGLYARALKLLKQRTRDPQLLRQAVRDYLKAAETMDQKRADRECVILASNPAAVRDGGIALLNRLAQMLWPFQFGAVDEFLARVRALELLALP